jgi:hypothetical protein
MRPSPHVWRKLVLRVVAVAGLASGGRLLKPAVSSLLCGQASTVETAFYVSAQSYTALGYGDVPLPVGSRLLGHLEAINGLLFFGLSMAVLFAIMNQLIAHRLRTETGY